MIKLNFAILDQPISIKQATFFVIEDVKVFASLTKLINQYDDDTELKLFDEKYRPLKQTELMRVTDVLGFDVNSPAMLKLIYADLEHQLTEKPEVTSMIEKLTATITELIDYELLEHELDLEDDEVTINELFKALGVKIEVQSDTVYERLLEIIQVYKYLPKKKLLILLNVCSYLTESELEELNEYITLNNCEVLFVEPRKVTGVRQCVLDEDYFLSFENRR